MPSSSCALDSSCGNDNIVHERYHDGDAIGCSLDSSCGNQNIIHTRYHDGDAKLHSANLTPPKVEETSPANDGGKFACGSDCCPLSEQHNSDKVGSASSHGIELPMVGGHVKFDREVDPMLAAAAYDDKNVVLVHGGAAFLVPLDEIDTSMVELACNDKGCALVAIGAGPSNDIDPATRS